MKFVRAALIVAIVLSGSGVGRAQSSSGSASGQGMAGTSQPPGYQSVGSVGQNPLFNSVPSGKPTSVPLQISITDAIQRGLKYNLGILIGQQSIRAQSGARLRSLSQLLPHLTTKTSEMREQANLAAFGFQGFPGISPIVGPFSVFDTRASLSQEILNLSDLSSYRSEKESLAATESSFENTRDLVVLVCVQLYLQAVAGNSRIEAGQAQLKTAQTLFELAVTRKGAGLVPGIDMLRAQVQMQSQQQRLIVVMNDFAKEKLNLAQAIGLPTGQDFVLTDRVPYVPFEAMSLAQALQAAYENRADYQSLQAQVRAAEAGLQSARRERYPSVSLDANYGIIGNSPDSSHGTFSVAVSLNIPVFRGRETEAKAIEAAALLEQKRAETESLRSQIYYELRAALLDLQSSEERVKVARSNLDLAGETVNQSQDRFSAGVVSNVEVVQAQEALASANEDYISSLYAHNVAKATLARALGLAVEDYERFLRGK